jgi:uncharacterized protein YlxW (UPF0749 family)
MGIDDVRATFPGCGKGVNAMATNVHSRVRAWLAPPSWVRGLRTGVTGWMLLAVAGWIFAGIVGVSAVRVHQETARMAVLAGLTPVSGAGVEVTLSDSTRALAPAENPSEALVQDSDLLLLEMMLWYGGARAVAVNGVRITAETPIISSGPTVVVDGHRMVAPFQVSAVGDQRLLQGVLQTRGGFLDRMRESGLGVQVVARSYVTVPATTAGATSQ